MLIFIVFAGGCRNFFTEEDFSRVNKVDAHVHINSDRGFFESVARRDNFKLITLNVDLSDSLSVMQQFGYAVRSVRKYEGEVFYSPTFHFDTTGWRSEAWGSRTIRKLNSYITSGAVSVKLWKNIGMTLQDKNGKFIMVDDPGLYPVIDFIAKKGLPLTGHFGEPRNCWLPLDKMTVKSDSAYFAAHPQYHMYLHPDFPSYDDQIRARDHLLEKFPGLIFIGCHLGSLEWNIDELAKRLDKFPNMAVDLAERICHLQYQSLTDYERIRNFCIRYQDRIIYGTDLEDDGTRNEEDLDRRINETWKDDWKYFTTKDKMTSNKFRGTFEGLHLPKVVIRKIFSENAVKWYKLQMNI